VLRRDGASLEYVLDGVSSLLLSAAGAAVDVLDQLAGLALNDEVVECQRDVGAAGDGQRRRLESLGEGELECLRHRDVTRLCQLVEAVAQLMQDFVGA